MHMEIGGTLPFAQFADLSPHQRGGDETRFFDMYRHALAEHLIEVFFDSCRGRATILFVTFYDRR